VLSYYHTALIYEEQVMCCMAEPKLYEISAGRSARSTNTSDRMAISHTDEIPRAGGDEAAAARQNPGRTCWPENVHMRAVSGARKTPANRFFFTSGPNMFDPFHTPRSRPILSGQGQRPVVRLLERPR